MSHNSIDTYTATGGKKKRVLCAANIGYGHTIPTLGLATRLRNSNSDLAIIARTAKVAGLASTHGIASIRWSLDSTVVRNPFVHLPLLINYGPDVTIVDYDPLIWLLLRAWQPPCRVSILRSELLMYHQRRNVFLPDKFGFSNGSATRRYNAILSAHNYGVVQDARDLFTGDIIAIPSVPEIDGLSDQTREFYRDRSIVYTGPLFVCSGNALSDELACWFVEKRQMGVPTALLTFGTIWGETFYQVLAEAFRSRGVGVVVVVPQENLRRRLAGLADNLLYVCGFTDLLSLARQVDIVVHHCGHGTLQMALLAGKPSLTLPSGEYDREDNAVRLEELGCGRHLGHDFFRRGLRAKAIVDAANQVLRRSELKRGLAVMSRILGEYVSGRGLENFEKALARHMGTRNP